MYILSRAGLVEALYSLSAFTQVLSSPTKVLTDNVSHANNTSLLPTFFKENNNTKEILMNFNSSDISFARLNNNLQPKLPVIDDKKIRSKRNVIDDDNNKYIKQSRCMQAISNVILQTKGVVTTPSKENTQCRQLNSIISVAWRLLNLEKNEVPPDSCLQHCEVTKNQLNSNIDQLTSKSVQLNNQEKELDETFPITDIDGLMRRKINNDREKISIMKNTIQEQIDQCDIQLALEKLIISSSESTKNRFETRCRTVFNNDIVYPDCPLDSELPFHGVSQYHDALENTRTTMQKEHDELDFIILQQHSHLLARAPLISK